MSIFQNALQGQIPAFSTSDADAQQQANAAQFMQRVAALRQPGQGGLPSPPAGRFLDQYKLASPWDAQGGRNRMNIPQARLPEAPQLRGEDMGEGETPDQGLDALAKVARASDQDNDPVRERLRQIDDRLKAMPPLPSAEDYAKDNSGTSAKYRPQIMTPLEGQDTGEVNPNYTPPDRKAFVKMMMPHAIKVAKETGIDARLVLAQAALETGWGKAAPGNNYFGIKGGNGPALSTTEAGPDGQLYSTKARFRSYGDPGDSAADYGKFLQNNSRYAPVLQAQGLDAQIDAMGKSGYATDPNYAAKLRQITSVLPTDGYAEGGEVENHVGHLVSVLGRKPTMGEMYATHLYGRGGLATLNASKPGRYLLSKFDNMFS